jgi:hypothetical protein
VSNTETVKAIYEAFGRGDVATILDKLDDAFEWESAVPGTSDGRSENSSITIIASAIIKRWATRSSTASIPGRPDDEFAVGRGSVGCSITANGPRDRTVELWNTTGSRVTRKVFHGDFRVNRRRDVGRSYTCREHTTMEARC